jgi:hypothetical protein
LIALSITGEHERRAEAGFMRAGDQYIGHTAPRTTFQRSLTDLSVSAQPLVSRGVPHAAQKASSPEGMTMRQPWHRGGASARTAVMNPATIPVR